MDPKTMVKIVEIWGNLTGLYSDCHQLLTAIAFALLFSIGISPEEDVVDIQQKEEEEGQTQCPDAAAADVGADVPDSQEVTVPEEELPKEEEEEGEQTQSSSLAKAWVNV